MNSVVSFVCIAVALCAALATAGPVFPYRLPVAGLRSYYYGGVPAAPVVASPYAPAVAPVPAAPAVVPDYYGYSAAAALSYPGGYPYAGYYGYPYAPYGYPYYKK
ncbi:hypothetical protein AVEN_39109-1 [Araneus ventricosus]|uniref:Uncharacterized protein n=1 Tax=Araneus ventricosus TaxID=182803 RepID=A0A4Y2DGD5_ARAVE|nr:hypothetical protein AVEN_39109-1 [Araneus ventricosus]